MTTASRRVCGHERISWGMGAPQGQPLQAFKPFEITIKTHQAPAIGNGQGRQMDIAVQSRAGSSMPRSSW
jgi:hypothetical protein